MLIFTSFFVHTCERSNITSGPKSPTLGNFYSIKSMVCEGS